MSHHAYTDINVNLGKKFSGTSDTSGKSNLKKIEKNQRGASPIPLNLKRNDLLSEKSHHSKNSSMNSLNILVGKLSTETEARKVKHTDILLDEVDQIQETKSEREVRTNPNQHSKRYNSQSNLTSDYVGPEVVGSVSDANDNTVPDLLEGDTDRKLISDRRGSINIHSKV
jgi:hypothetical protein